MILIAAITIVALLAIAAIALSWWRSNQPSTKDKQAMAIIKDQIVKNPGIVGVCTLGESTPGKQTMRLSFDGAWVEITFLFKTNCIQFEMRPGGMAKPLRFNYGSSNAAMENLKRIFMDYMDEANRRIPANLSPAQVA